MPPSRQVRRRSARSRRPLNLLAILLPVGMAMVLGASVFVYLLQNDHPAAMPFVPTPSTKRTPAPSLAPVPPLTANVAIKLPPRPTNHPPANLAEVLQAYQNQAGGPKARENLKTLLLSGNMTVNGRTFALEVLRKAPDLYRLQIEDRAGRLIVGGDSQTAWMAYREAGGRLAVWPIGAPALDWLRLLAPFGTALMADPLKPAGLALGEKAAIAANGNPLWPVTFSNGTGQQVTYFLDDQKFLLHRMELGGVAIAQSRAADFDDWQAASEIQLPKKITLRGGGPPVTITFDRLQFNTGLLNAAFQAPVVEAPLQPARSTALPQPPVLADYGFPWVWPW